MTNLFNKLSNALSNVVLFTAAVVMAGLGFAVVGALALFALVAVAVAMIASPFVQLQKQRNSADIAGANATA